MSSPLAPCKDAPGSADCGQQDRLADALFAGTRHYEVQLHCNKGLAGAPEDRIAAARDTAMNPAVPDAFALAIIAGGDPHTAPGLPDREPNLAAGRKATIAITAAADELRSIVPATGAYVCRKLRSSGVYQILVLELLQMVRKRRTGNIQLLANLTDDQTVRAEARFSTLGRKHSA